MKLWLLQPKTGRKEEGAWSPFYGKVFGFVVRAETEAKARKAAHDHGEGERYVERVWFDSQLIECTEVLADGPPEVILRDYEQDYDE